MLKRGINVEVLDEDKEIIRASFKGHEELILDRDSSIMPYNLAVLAGDKGFTKRILLEHGIAVPLGEVFKAKDIDYLKDAFHILNCPVVIKPIFGSHGFDVYINLQTDYDVAVAAAKIMGKKGPDTPVLIEEYFGGKEFRVFVTKDGNYATLLRDPAHVYGDGIHNIQQLIEQENYRRMNPRTNSLCEIMVDSELLKYINDKGLSLRTVPQKDEKVYLRANSNIATGGVSEDYTDRTHPSVIDIGLRVLKAFNGLPYIGIDFMTKDIEAEQTNDSYRIIEINTNPGMHMHFEPAIGKSQNIAKYIVDLMYPETKK